MFARENMPDWVKAFLVELMKPPTFLLGEEKKQVGFQPVLQMEDDEASKKKHDGQQSELHDDSGHGSEQDGRTRRPDGLDQNAPKTGVQTAKRPKSAASGRRPQFPVSGSKPAASTSAAALDIEEKNDVQMESGGEANQGRKWRAIFTQSGIPANIASLYGWTVKEAHTVDNIVQVKTAKRLFAVKPTHIPPERVVFLQNLCKHAKNNGFQQVPKYATTQRREPFVSHNGKTFYATQWIEGTHANFANLTHISQVSKSLAEFYEATRGFETTDYHPPMEFQLAYMLRRRIEDLRALLLDAELKKERDEFDDIFLELAPALRSDAEESLRFIEDERCQFLLNREEENPGVCHLDVIPGNFIYDGAQKMHLIDLDLATYAPRALDISHLLRRSLQLTNWNPEAAYTCFLHYDSVRSIPAEEYLLIQGLLRFPYRAWRIAHTRYRQFADTLQDEEIRAYRTQEERRQAFLSAFTREIERQP